MGYAEASSILVSSTNFLVGYSPVVIELVYMTSKICKGCGNLMGDWDEVVREAKKCELLCLNCHREYHNH